MTFRRKNKIATAKIVVENKSLTVFLEPGGDCVNNASVWRIL